MNLFNTVGTDVTKSPNPLMRAGLDWTVSKQPIFTDNPRGGDPVSSSRHFATVRSDTSNILGIVGPDYQVVQNEELLYLCSRLATQGVEMETAGSLSGGARTWIQLKGDSFGVGPNKDEVKTMTLFTNGHDGQWPLACLPTSIRVYCQNTLNLVMQAGHRSNMIITLRHTANVNDRLEQMIFAVQNFKDRSTIFENQVHTLGSTTLGTRGIQEFWTNLYTSLFGDIYVNPTTEAEKDATTTATSVLAKWANTFDTEVKHSGPNLWTAMNAVTYWIDHQQIYRGEKKHENQFNDVLFGDGAKEKVKVMNAALALAY